MDVLSRLSDAGYSQNRIRREKLIGQATLTQLRHGDLVSWKTIDTICGLLDCQPGSFLEYIPDDAPAGDGGEVKTPE
ncbi:MAG: helix-turn-helix transcriptional regulator [Clostridia bacterium]|nr:helix-turn-helix transcriptional regulator [Clostridia bacterium]